MNAIDGKSIAEDILQELGVAPKKFLAVVLIGEDPASASFLKIKENTAKKLGVDFRLYKFPEIIKNDDLRKEVRKVALHKTCGGVIVQLPLPEHVNAQYILNVIPPEKDVDVLGERALGAFYAGRNPVLPPAAGVVDSLLSTFNFQLSTSTVAVVGLGQLVGKPIAVWLMRKTKDLCLLRKGSDFSVLKNVDLVITGAGVPGLIKPEMLKDGVNVIDFGYGTESVTSDKRQVIRKIRGDFDFETIPMSHAAINFYTPTPGGTGPILVVKLFENFYKLNQNY